LELAALGRLDRRRVPRPTPALLGESDALASRAGLARTAGIPLKDSLVIYSFTLHCTSDKAKGWNH